MPNQVEIVVTGRDAGATKVLDNVTASQRASAKQAAETAKAQQLAADVVQKAGGQISETSVRMVRAREAERQAAADLAKVQAATRKGYLDEAQGARAAAAAMQQLAKAKMEVVAINAAPPPKPMSLMQAGEALEKRELGGQLGTHDFLRERLNERVGEFGITENMGGMTAAVAAGGVVVGELANKMREAVAESLEFGEAMSRAAAKTGLSVETLSVLHYAAQTTGGDFDSMTSAVAKMDKAIGAATEGNKKAQAFMKALGLNARQLADDPRGAEIAFQKLAQTLAATENPIRRVELATALLGERAGAEQIKTLMELGRGWDEFRAGAERTGNLLDSRTAAALENTQRQLKTLGQAATGAGLAFTEGLLPALDRLLNSLSFDSSDMNAFKALGEDIGKVFEYAGAKIADAASAAFAFDAAIHGGPFSDKGKVLLDESERMDVLAQRMKYEAMPDWMKGLLPTPPGPTAGNRAYQAGLGRQTESSGDPMLDAIRKRNAARGAGAFGGVGDLTGNPEQKRLKQMEDSLNDEKLQFGLSVKAEYDYWTAKQDAFAHGSAQYDAIKEKRKTLAEEGAKKAHEEIAKFQSSEVRDAGKDVNERQQAESAGTRAMTGMNRQAAQAQESRYDTSNELYAMQQRVQMQLAEMAVRQAAGKTITEEAAAMQSAAIHTAMYGAELDRLEAKRKAIKENSLLSNGEADQQRKMDELTQKIAELEGNRQIQVAQDTYAIKNADQSAVKGATDALNEFRMSAMDTAAQMRELTSTIVNGLHRQLLDAVTGKKTDMKGLGHDVATGVADMALKKLESNAMASLEPMLKKLGLGGMFAGKRDGSTASTALWVQPVGAAGSKHSVPGLPKLPGMTNEWGGSSDDNGSGDQQPGAVGMLKHLGTGLKDVFGKLFHHGGGGSGAAGSDDSGDDTVGPEGLLSTGMGIVLGGGKGGDGKSPSSPLYVSVVNGGKGGSVPGLSSFLGKGGGDSGDDSGSSSGGGIFSSLFSMFGKGGDSGPDGGGGFDFSSMADMFSALPGFADGVTDFAGGPAIVGERGPELVNLPRGANVIPNHKMADVGGPKYEHHGDIVIHGGSGMDREGMRSMVHQAVDTRMRMHMRGAGYSMADAKSRLPSARRGF